MIRLDAARIDAIIRRHRGSRPPDGVRCSDVSFWSDGCRIAGNLWRPAGGVESPAILMVHGRGDVKEHLNLAYAPRFAAAGFIVLTFDYRGWGESEGRILDADSGEIREAVNPQANLADLRHALDFLCGDPQVNGRLALWGSSLGGKHALQLAIEHSDVIEGLVIQAGNLSGSSTPDRSGGARRINFARTGLDDESGEAASIESRSTSLPANLEQLAAATLILDAGEDEFFDVGHNGVKLFEAIRDQVRAEYQVLPGRHYDVFVGRTYERAITLAIDWLVDIFVPRDRRKGG